MKERRAIVIGSGFGGLAVAIRLQAMGFKTTLLEKREKVGGRAYQLRDRGYTFDMGPSLITAPSILRRLFAAAGRQLEDYVELVPLDPFYRVYFHDGTYLDYTADRERMRAQMARFNPQDAARYDRFMEATRPIYEAVIREGLGARPFDTLGKLLAFLPRALRLGAIQPVTRFASRYFEDFRHHFLYSFHPLFIGGNPFRAPAVYIMIPYLEREEGVWFARGGMYSLVEAMARLFMEIGGRIHTGTPVQRIVVQKGRAVGVETADGFHPAELVVSNADPGYTYQHLVDPAWRRRWTDRRIARLHYSMSCFLLYLGVRRTYPQLLHHTLMLSPRYRELIEDIFERKVLAPDFSLYLHAPTRTDPTMAPPGCESLYVLAPVPHLQASVDWTEEAPRYAGRLLEFLEAWGLEGLQENLEVCHYFTPEDFARHLNAPYGSAFSIEPRLTQTAYFRPHNRSEDIRGLYLVGAGTHPGAGLPGVVLSAEATAWAIAQDYRVTSPSIAAVASA
ncbi:phytoene desaturase [Rhodothermus marinus]|uniref:Phytoene dehydrogenase n=1 Tax=Rhodothermus marinus (strain ATCC 43812 / DSM 4252 / R-10) TaxID=518766 RepID=D0MJ26_RHOM4|nr:phytoene desaturase [Rhodothermus marinus]ACY48484.1 phytoene desaturase [Rhodothermus marinus DSM 4252]